MSCCIYIGKPTAWAIALVNIAFAIIQFLNFVVKLNIEIPFLQSIQWTGIFISIIIFTNDVYYNTIYQKWFWITSMVILAPITPIFYLIQRNKLIKLGEKFNKD
jgi:hypothetical protein